MVLVVYLNLFILVIFKMFKFVFVIIIDFLYVCVDVEDKLVVVNFILLLLSFSLVGGNFWVFILVW